jgi:Flp pilus assembly protein TadD
MTRHLAEEQVLQIVSESSGRLALFLGAGASVSSGVPAAGAMIREWRQMAHRYARSDEPLESWCARQEWYEREHEYSALFAQLYPNAQTRQVYIERKVADGTPGWGYLYLANLMAHGWFKVALTTNFDNLLAEALSRYTGDVPVVCAADSEVMSVSLASRRPKIIKLHGDYLFPHQKHTVEELEQLGAHMKVKFGQITQDHGLLVLGYGGRDRSIMGPLREALQNVSAFGPGIYWGLWRTEAPSSMVTELAEAHPDRFHLFTYEDFDRFAAMLHKACQMPLPAPVRDPHGTLKAMLKGLVADGPADGAAAEAIAQDREALQREVDRSDLLQALVALARRDAAAALRITTAFVQRHPDDAQGHLAMGSALMQRYEDGGAPEDSAAALEHLRAAVRLDPQNVAAQYNLTMHRMRSEADLEAIEAARRLLEQTPRDKYARTSLAQLLLKHGQVADAAEQIRICLRNDPADASMHGMWSTLMMRNGNTDEALKAVDQAIRLKPGNAAFHSHRGQILAAMMRLQDAVAALEEAVRLDPQDHFTRLALARCLMAQGAVGPAVVQARQVLEGNPDSTEAAGMLGQLHAQQREFTLALGYLNRVVEATPGDPRAWSVRGHAQLQMGAPGPAEQDFLQVLRLNPRDPGTLSTLAWLYFGTQRPDRLQWALGELHQVAPQMAQLVQAQMQMGMAPAPVHAAGGGMFQRFIDALR